MFFGTKRGKPMMNPAVGARSQHIYMHFSFFVLFCGNAPAAYAKRQGRRPVYMLIATVNRMLGNPPCRNMHTMLYAFNHQKKHGRIESTFACPVRRQVDAKRRTMGHIV